MTTALLSYSQMTRLLNGLTRDSAREIASQAAAIRKLLLTDLYALIHYGLGRQDIEHEWLFERCREVQLSPNGHLDLWAREHYKSTIITLGHTVFDILSDPDVTVGFFSHTRPIAKGFLRQIKREFEANERLKTLFPDILWDKPDKEAPTWSEDSGIVVKRQTNPKESTLEAWGLVDGQPTSKHFRLMVYDDVVTQDSVTTPDMIEKVTRAWELSRNLSSEGGKTRYIGTRYHYNDTYREIINRGAAKPRLYPATRDGTVAGDPVLLSRERLAEKRKEQGPYTFGCQMLQDPKADKAQGFVYDWIRFYEGHDTASEMNVYILVDGASEKKKNSDYTAMVVVGLAADQNYYILDMVRDRLKLTERADALFRLHKRWKPLAVGYEKYGMMADIEHIKDRQNRENYRFEITELGGPLPKPDRIRRLVPLFEQGRIWLPQSLTKVDYEGVPRELVGLFIEEEYKAFPVGLHDDVLDAMARLLDEEMALVWPEEELPEDDRYTRRYAPRRQGSWMTA